jgi:hypothetical protein
MFTSVKDEKPIVYLKNYYKSRFFMLFFLVDGRTRIWILEAQKHTVRIQIYLTSINYYCICLLICIFLLQIHAVK